jgi:hypothetical protein
MAGVLFVTGRSTTAEEINDASGGGDDRALPGHPRRDSGALLIAAPSTKLLG